MEHIFLLSDILSVMVEISEACSGWEIRHVHIVSLSVVNAWISITKDGHYHIADFAVQQVAKDDGVLLIDVIVRNQIPKLNCIHEGQEKEPHWLLGQEFKDSHGVVAHSCRWGQENAQKHFFLVILRNQRSTSHNLSGSF